MPQPRIPDPDGINAVATVGNGGGDRAMAALAVRWVLQELARIAPGKSVEVRVPPHGAVQIVEGPGHTRGTPPNVIEMDAETLIALARGSETWDAARERGGVHASGIRANMDGLLPLMRLSE